MRYFTVKEGALVSRFGSGTYLGAVVSVHQTGSQKGETEIKWTGEVVVLTDEDFRLYGREYEQLLREKALVEVDQAAYDKFVLAQTVKTESESAQTAAEMAKAKADVAKLEAEQLEAELKALQERAAKAKANAVQLSKEAAAATKEAPRSKE